MTTKQREASLRSAALRSQQLDAGAGLLPGDDWALALLDANERLEQAERERDLLRFRHRQAILRECNWPHVPQVQDWWSKIWN